MKVLGIETSCDDTSASVVENGKIILSNVVQRQDDFHREFAGVVPEIASRKHIELMHPVIDKALRDAKCTLADLDAVAVTARPGLAGSLLVGVNSARALAWAAGLPLVEANHLGSHLYSINLCFDVEYPIIGLIVSGGHTLLVYAESSIDIKVIGTTIDDACGEAFDKVAKHLGLGFPGGPAVDRLAQSGDERSVVYPQSRLTGEKERYHFSYSGLKTAVVYWTEKYKKAEGDLSVNDICAGFQRAALMPLYEKAMKACSDFDVKTIGVVGGVAANSLFRKLFDHQKMVRVLFPRMDLCMDNAAMVAGYGTELFKAGRMSDPMSSRPDPSPMRRAGENIK